MNHERVVVALLTSLIFSCAQSSARPAPLTTHQKEPRTMRVTGPFDVKLTPLPADPSLPEGFATRLRIDKVFHGDLQATSVGQMLAVNTAVEDSGAYVAVDRVEGSLGGRRGTFALVHLGTMARGQQSLTLPVVPDSGTGDLTGLTGELAIQIAPDGQHSYVLEYSLP